MTTLHDHTTRLAATLPEDSPVQAELVKLAGGQSFDSLRIIAMGKFLSDLSLRTIKALKGISPAFAVKPGTVFAQDNTPYFSLGLRDGPASTSPQNLYPDSIIVYFADDGAKRQFKVSVTTSDQRPRDKKKLNVHWSFNPDGVALQIANAIADLKYMDRS